MYHAHRNYVVTGELPEDVVKIEDGGSKVTIYKESCVFCKKSMKDQIDYSISPPYGQFSVITGEFKMCEECYIVVEEMQRDIITDLITKAIPCKKCGRHFPVKWEAVGDFSNLVCQMCVDTEMPEHLGKSVIYQTNCEICNGLISKNRLDINNFYIDVEAIKICCSAKALTIQSVLIKIDGEDALVEMTTRPAEKGGFVIEICAYVSEPREWHKILYKNISKDMLKLLTEAFTFLYTEYGDQLSKNKERERAWTTPK